MSIFHLKSSFYWYSSRICVLSHWPHSCSMHSCYYVACRILSSSLYYYFVELRFFIGFCGLHRFYSWFHHFLWIYWRSSFLKIHQILCWLKSSQKLYPKSNIYYSLYLSALVVASLLKISLDHEFDLVIIQFSSLNDFELQHADEIMIVPQLIDFS